MSGVTETLSSVGEFVSDPFGTGWIGSALMFGPLGLATGLVMDSLSSKKPDAPLLTSATSLEAEANANSKAQMEIFRKQQRGAAATMLTTTSQKSGKSLLGG